MIHLNYKLTKKEFKKYFYQANIIYNMKIYVVILGIAMILMNVLGLIFSNETLQTTGFTLFTTFIPTLILCAFLSVFISWYDLRRLEKNHSDIMEGEFKIRFEKRFIIWQINGQNKKLTYDPYRLYKGFKGSALLSHLEKKHIVIPEGLLTKEQLKTIKENIRG